MQNTKRLTNPALDGSITYSEIMLKLEERGREEASRFRTYCLKHPRKSEGRRDPSLFWFSLGRQVRDFTENGNPKGFKTPLSEKQARFADKVCSGAYEFIRSERRKAGGWGNHCPKCPVLLGLNAELGLVIEDGIIICEGCNGELGRLRVPVEPETTPSNLDDIDLPATLDLDSIELDLDAIEVL